MQKSYIDKTLGNNPDIINIKKTRANFNKLKNTPEFAEWKKYQFGVQMGKCAWCEMKLSKKFTNVHIDHALPIFHGGTNSYNNLVLSHAKCNMQKWIRVDAVPQWIVNRRSKLERRRNIKPLIAEQWRVFREAQDIEVQTELAQWFNTWI